ncbi:MAG TPA: hypothetical protein PKC21_05410 [Oligoflexia bacterium]|nr:hypothetical protein [Oligoflexia bacterium]HMR24773.1 hypothetical protein [Oligoflexia bacterium]
MKPSLLKICYVLFFGASVSLGFTQGIDETSLVKNFFYNADTLSFGGAGRATYSSGQNMILNPAAIARHKNKVSFGGSYMSAGATSSSPWSLFATDYRASQALSFGAFYGYDKATIEGTEAKINYAAIALAKDVTKNFFIGTNIKAYKTKYSGMQTGGPDGVDADLGIQFKPSDYLSLGFTMNHIFQGKNFEEFPLLIAGGVALELEGTGKLLVDLENDLSKTNGDSFNAYFGGEVFLMDGFFLRGGFGIDNVRDADFFSAGLVLQGPKINMVGVYSQTVEPVDKTFGVSVDVLF